LGLSSSRGKRGLYHKKKKADRKGGERVVEFFPMGRLPFESRKKTLSFIGSGLNGPRKDYRVD